MYACAKTLHGGRLVGADWFVRAWPNEATYKEQPHGDPACFACCERHLPQALLAVTHAIGVERPFITLRNVKGVRP